jgi:hypothetical protein
MIAIALEDYQYIQHHFTATSPAKIEERVATDADKKDSTYNACDAAEFSRQGACMTAWAGDLRMLFDRSLYRCVLSLVRIWLKSVRRKCSLFLGADRLMVKN